MGRCLGRTKVKANASKQQAMSYAGMKEREQHCVCEVRELLAQAERGRRRRRALRGRSAGRRVTSELHGARPAERFARRNGALEERCGSERRSRKAARESATAQPADKEHTFSRSGIRADEGSDVWCKLHAQAAVVSELQLIVGQSVTPAATIKSNRTNVSIEQQSGGDPRLWRQIISRRRTWSIWRLRPVGRPIEAIARASTA